MPSFLTTDERNKLPLTDFALPGRRYPVHDRNHAKAALARVSANGTSAEKAAVISKVKAKYPDMNIDSGMARD